MKFERYPKRDAVKDYFLLPNELFSLGLSSGEIAVYSYLLRCENRESYQCWPSCETIGRAVGQSKKTVRKYVAMLEDKRLIATEPTLVRQQDGCKRNGNLLYTIRPIQEAIDAHQRRQMRRLEEATARHELKKRAEKHGLNITVNEQGA